MEIIELEILTDDLDRTLTFYTETLGIPLLKRKPNSISFSIGSSVLTFVPSNHLNPIYHFACNIPDNKVEEALHFMANKIEIIPVSDHEMIADFFKWNARAFYFYDNNGNILELIARIDLDKKSNALFNGNAILCISEVGIVTEDVIKLANELMASENLSLFSRQESKEDFTVLGDDNGLLILVSMDRPWFPTDQRSKKHYLNVKLLVDGVQKELTFAPKSPGAFAK